MATRLACDRADLVSAIAPVAGTLRSRVRCAPSRPVSVMQIHGTVIRWCPSAAARWWAAAAQRHPLRQALADLWRAVDGCRATDRQCLQRGTAVLTGRQMRRQHRGGAGSPRQRQATPGRAAALRAAQAIVGPTTFAVDGSQAWRSSSPRTDVFCQTPSGHSWSRGSVASSKTKCA